MMGVVVGVGCVVGREKEYFTYVYVSRGEDRALNEWING